MEPGAHSGHGLGRGLRVLQNGRAPFGKAVGGLGIACVWRAVPVARGRGGEKISFGPGLALDLCSYQFVSEFAVHFFFFFFFFS